MRVIVVPFLESDRGSQNLFHRILNAVGVHANLGEPVKSQVNVTLSRFEIHDKFNSIPMVVSFETGSPERNAIHLMERTLNKCDTSLAATQAAS